MRLAGKLGIVVLTVLLAAAPSMACLLPMVTLTTAERECCKHMSEQCGSAGMPNSHSCCQRLAGPDTSRLVLSSSHDRVSSLVALGIHVTSLALRFLVSNSAAGSEWLNAIHAPPESPPVFGPVLKI